MFSTILDANDCVGWQTHATQPLGDCRNDAVGFGVGQSSRFPVGEALAIVAVNEGKRVWTLPGGAAQDLIDGDAARIERRLRRCACRIAKDHCSARFGWRHHVSGK
jgi:hypothetical protein